MPRRIFNYREKPLSDKTVVYISKKKLGQALFEAQCGSIRSKSLIIAACNPATGIFYMAERVGFEPTWG